jgi:hypothetical protein
LSVTEGVSPVVDQNEGADIVAPIFATFLGDQSLKVLSAQAVSLRSFRVIFSKDILATGIPGGADNAGYYAISPALGTVVSAQRLNGADANKVLITHTLDQGSAFYSVVVDTLLESTGGENLSASPLDRTTFQGLGGTVTSIDQGALFEDPFGDGSTFSFVFEHQGQIYAGPNDNNDAVFRFNPDGSNAITVTFQNDSGFGAPPFTSFGNSVERPAFAVDNPAGNEARYFLTPDTDLSAIQVGDLLLAANCDIGANNTGATAITAIDDAADTVTVDFGSGGSGPDSGCEITMYNNAGPGDNDGIDAFVSATVNGADYLVFGAHNFGGGNFKEVYYTQDVDSVLDNDFCNVTGVTLGNTESLQTIYGFGNYLYMGYASDTARLPVLSYMQLSGSTCSGLTNKIRSGSGAGQEANALPYLGAGGSVKNLAANIGIDSIIAFNDGTGTDLYIANNGGIASSSNLPPTTSTVWADVKHDQAGANTWDGTTTTQEIPSIGKLRPGEKGIPVMMEWGGFLFVARNRTDGVAEIWKYNNASGWAKVVDTSVAMAYHDRHDCHSICRSH